MRPRFACIKARARQKLEAKWPNYLAFLASFFYVGIIWLNHRVVFWRARAEADEEMKNSPADEFL